jgi:putative FmdB family regulatory protein
MPLYEYQCVKCGKKSEFIRNFSDPHETKCPRCGGALKKLLSSPAFQFKGSGFYATDYRKAGGSPSEDSKSEKSEEKKDSSKGEEGKSGVGGGSESKDAEAGAGKKEGDSAKGGKDSGGAPSAAPSPPAGPSSPAPSKKKDRDRK